MKRAAPLVPLSREHHEALVLARRACEPARAEPAALRLHVLQRWDAQFEGHFATEEATLLPALEAAGCVQDARDAAAQHARLRDLVARLRAGDLDALPAWGEAMREHVQWEERYLFPRAESLLDLPAIADGLDRGAEQSAPASAKVR